MSLADTLARLTPRQIDLACLVVDGKNAKEISRERGLAMSTVRNHVQEIYRRLKIRGRSQLSALLRIPTSDEIQNRRKLDVSIDQDPRLADAMRVLKARLNTCRERGAMTVAIVDNMIECVAQHRRECATRGIVFPELTPFVLAEQNYIQFVRKDLDDAGIAILLKELTVAFPVVTGRELATGMLGAFPHKRPGSVELPRAA